MESLL
ncbi:hypothetical protein BpHYR1_009865 [Brachionus plicatilis]